MRKVYFMDSVASILISLRKQIPFRGSMSILKSFWMHILFNYHTNAQEFIITFSHKKIRLFKVDPFPIWLVNSRAGISAWLWPLAEPTIFHYTFPQVLPLSLLKAALQVRGDRRRVMQTLGRHHWPQVVTYMGRQNTDSRIQDLTSTVPNGNSNHNYCLYDKKIHKVILKPPGGNNFTLGFERVLIQRGEGFWDWERENLIHKLISSVFSGGLCRQMYLHMRSHMKKSPFISLENSVVYHLNDWHSRGPAKVILKSGH